MRTPKAFARPIDDAGPSPVLQTIAAHGPTAFVENARTLVSGDRDSLRRRMREMRSASGDVRGVLSIEIGGGEEPGTHDAAYVTEADVLADSPGEREGTTERRAREATDRAVYGYDERREFLVQIIEGSMSAMFRVALGEA